MRFAYQLVGLMCLLVGSASGSAAEEARLIVQADRTQIFEVGEPLELELEVRAPLEPLAQGADPLLAERRARAALRAQFGPDVFEEGALDYSWTLLDSQPVVIRRTPGQELGAELIATRRFRLVSLEAGERSLPTPAFEGIVPVVTRSFASLLAEGEDEPRPLIGFLELPAEPPAEAPRAWWPAAALGGVLLFAVGALLLRRRAAQPAGSLPDPQLALSTLVAETKARGAGAAAIQAAHFQLTALLRAAFDYEPTLKRSRGAEPADALSQRGATDEEWLVARSARLSEVDSAELAAWFAGCAEVKYGGAPATEWGLEARVEQARTFLNRRPS